MIEELFPVRLGTLGLREWAEPMVLPMLDESHRKGKVGSCSQSRLTGPSRCK